MSKGLTPILGSDIRPGMTIRVVRTNSEDKTYVARYEVDEILPTPTGTRRKVYYRHDGKPSTSYIYIEVSRTYNVEIELIQEEVNPFDDA